jgi:hypothetical protein
VYFRAVVINPCQAYLLVVEETKLRREKTMFTPIKKIARALRVPSVEEREMAYLNGSHDRFDLEYRQRQIDRGLFRMR